MDPILESIIAWITITGGVLALFKPVRSFFVWIWKKTLGRRGEQLNRIEAQLVSNSGTSLRDAVRRIEERQNAFDAFLRAQLNLHNVAILRANAEGRVYSINREYQRLIGADLSQVSGEGWINTIHPDHRGMVMDNWQKAVLAGREFHEEVQFVRADTGQPFTASMNVYREMDREGRIVGYLGVIVPVVPECPYKGQCNAIGGETR